MLPSLQYEVIHPEGSTPERWYLVLHGILGRRINWRGFCQKLSARRPEYGFVLVDLPEHGESPDSQAPHEIETIADHLLELEASLPMSIRGGIGHSFGGKTLTAWATKSPSDPEELWLIDSNPSPRPDGRGSEVVRQLVSDLKKQHGPYDTRRDFVTNIKGLGYPEPIAQWLAMNLLRGDDERLRFRARPAIIEQMIDHYFLYDGWPAIESIHPGRAWHLVIAGRSENYDLSDRERAARLAEESDTVKVHTIVNSGHWVHTERPTELLDVFAAASR